MQGQDAVSPVIGTLLILVIFTVLTATVVTVVLPSLKEYQEDGKVATVASQITSVAAKAKQLAVSGNSDAVAQGTIALPGGTLQMVPGHVVATTIELRDYDYVADETLTKGAHERFHLEPVAPATSLFPDTAQVRIVYRNDAARDDFPARIVSARFDGEFWDDRYTVDGVLDKDNPIDMWIEDPVPATYAIRDGPWRLRIFDGLNSDPSTLLAEIYLHTQTGLDYSLGGESGLYRVRSENGAVFRQEDGRWREVSPGLVQPPVTATGSELFTVRNMELNTTRGDSASGHTRVGVLMKLNMSDTFLDRGGAWQVRVQYWGDHWKAWEEHLRLLGFADEDAGVADGVRWNKATTGLLIETFPVNYAYARIDVRLTST